MGNENEAEHGLGTGDEVGDRCGPGAELDAKADIEIEVFTTEKINCGKKMEAGRGGGNYEVTMRLEIGMILALNTWSWG